MVARLSCVLEYRAPFAPIAPVLEGEVLIDLLGSGTEGSFREVGLPSTFTSSGTITSP